MIRRLRPSLLLVLFSLALGWGLWVQPRTSLQGAQPTSATKPVAVDFAKEIAPLLVERCVSCHNASQMKGKLDLSSSKTARQGGHSGPAIVPHQPADSVLLEFITPGKDGNKPAMPKKGDPLSAAQLTLLKRWIADGATWPDSLILREKTKADATWWSLQPLKAIDPKITPNMPATWQRSPIDRFIYAQIAEKGLTPSPRADGTLIRRVTYDLLGLPPTPAEVTTFESDTRPDAYAQLIDRLLASPHYGERWGRHWLDVARFGESTGFERNIIIDNAWPYRDYVIESFNNDKPFDRFLQEQLAGDIFAMEDPDADVGTTFLVAGPYDNVGNQDVVQKAQIQANTVDEILTAAGTAFLGLTINCARCHDHKFDPITQADYYRFYSAFTGITHTDRVVATRKQRQEHHAQTQPLIARKEQLTKDKSGNPAEIARELEQVEKSLKAIPPLPRVWAGRFTQPAAPAYVMLGGDPQKRGPIVPPASLEVLQPITKSFELKPEAPEYERRLALAQWLTQPDQPLTPRVWANRVWHYHFGTGLVDTPSDFGYQGGRPSHPELLDWLAKRVHTHGWKLKPLHRDILLSETYQQASTFRESAADVDASTRSLWRYPPRRLSAEEVRDSLLTLSGQLDPRMGGPGFRLYRYVQDNVATYLPLDQVGPETYRRSVYHQYARASRVDVLSDFDCPDNAFSTPTRSSTTTPLQALTLMNHTFTHDMARHLATRIAKDAGPNDIPTQIRHLFTLAYSRFPTPQELTSATQLVQQHGLVTLCRAVLNSNELIYLE